MGSLWSILTIVGPILLAAVLIWAIVRNRQQSTPREKMRTEQATKRLYDKIEQDEAEKGHS